MSELSIEYIAGLFDGEGWVGIVTSKQSPYYQLQVSITNTCLDVLLLCQKQFGGSISKKPDRPLTRKFCYQWRASTKRAGIFLKAISPYAIIKKQHVEVALEFMSVRPLYQRVSDDKFLLFEDLRKKMKQLNSYKTK